MPVKVLFSGSCSGNFIVPSTDNNKANTLEALRSSDISQFPTLHLCLKYFTVPLCLCQISCKPNPAPHFDDTGTSGQYISIHY